MVCDVYILIVQSMVKIRHFFDWIAILKVCNTINEQQCNTQYSQQCSSLPISPRRQEPSFTQQRQRNNGGGGYVQSGSFSRQSSSFNSGQTQTFSGNIKDVASVPRVISVTKFRNGQNNRDPTQSRSIINRYVNC